MDNPIFSLFSNLARKVMIFARQEAERFNHDYIGTEHILLGLAYTDVCLLFNSHGISRDDIRKHFDLVLKRNPDVVTMGQLPFTPRAKKAIEFAIRESKLADSKEVLTCHILVGLLSEQEGAAATALNKFGLTLQKARSEGESKVDNKDAVIANAGDQVVGKCVISEAPTPKVVRRSPYSELPKNPTVSISSADTAPADVVIGGINISKMNKKIDEVIALLSADRDYKFFSNPMQFKAPSPEEVKAEKLSTSRAYIMRLHRQNIEMEMRLKMLTAILGVGNDHCTPKTLANPYTGDCRLSATGPTVDLSDATAEMIMDEDLLDHHEYWRELERRG